MKPGTFTQIYVQLVFAVLSNHVHILLGLNPSLSISDTVHEVKRSSTLFINNEQLCCDRFSWQEGYGAFSYSRSQISKIYRYIENQEEHHRLKTFREEYTQYLKKREMEFDERFLYEFWENPV